MGPDYLFVVSGGVVLLAAFVVLVLGLRRGSRKTWLDAGLWTCLAAGLFLQGFAPNLKVERNSFVIPAPATSTAPTSPRELVDRERQMKVLSALVTGVATLGLLVRHRRLFTNSPGPSDASCTSRAEPTETPQA